MESLLIIALIILGIVIYRTEFNERGILGSLCRSHQVEWFLRYGKCYDCGSFSSHKTYLSVSNQNYHDSPLDICCSLYCKCHLETSNVFTHFFYNKPEDKEFYDLAISYNNTTISWYKEWKENGDKESLEDSLKLQKERELAKSLGL